MNPTPAARIQAIFPRPTAKNRPRPPPIVSAGHNCGSPDDSTRALDVAGCAPGVAGRFHCFHQVGIERPAHARQAFQAGLLKGTLEALHTHCIAGDHRIDEAAIFEPKRLFDNVVSCFFDLPLQFLALVPGPEALQQFKEILIERRRQAARG